MRVGASLFVIALLLRAISWERSAVLFNDGPRFLRQAAAAAAADWPAFFSESYHPLYALATACVAKGGWSLESSGAWVSIVSGSAAVPVLYLLLRESFGSPCDALGALLFALHSRAIEFSADVQSEGLYLLLYLVALLFAWRALRSGRVGHFAAGGFFAGAAYWVRPEGLAVALVVAVVASGRVWTRALAPRRALLALAALALGCALWVVPYINAVHATTGTLTLTQKKVLLAENEFRVAPEGGGVPALERVRSRERGSTLSALEDFAKSARSSLRPTLMVALVLGLWFLHRDPPGLRAAFFATLTLVFASILLVLVMRSGYISRRHFFPALVPLFGYAAYGLLAFRARLAVWLARRSAFFAALGRPVPALFGLAALLLLPHQLEAKRLDKLAERRAAEWIAYHVGPGRVAGVGGRVGYYARRPMLDVGAVAPAAIADALEQNGVPYAVLDKENEIAALDADPRYRRIHEVNEAGVTAVVFRGLDIEGSH